MVAPSGRASGARALRRLSTPQPIEVRAGVDGIPNALRRRGRWLRVEEVLDRYRTDDRWWTAAPVSRTYYELLLEGGRTVTVFRNEISGGWCEQRYG